MGPKGEERKAALKALQQNESVLQAAKRMGEAFFTAMQDEGSPGCNRLAFAAAVAACRKGLSGGGLFDGTTKARAPKWGSPERLPLDVNDSVEIVTSDGEEHDAGFVCWSKGARANRGYATVLVDTPEGKTTITARILMPVEEEEDE